VRYFEKTTVRIGNSHVETQDAGHCYSHMDGVMRQSTDNSWNRAMRQTTDNPWKANYRTMRRSMDNAWKANHRAMRQSTDDVWKANCKPIPGLKVPEFLVCWSPTSQQNQ
jgi:hypothetical protein